MTQQVTLPCKPDNLSLTLAWNHRNLGEENGPHRPSHTHHDAHSDVGTHDNGEEPKAHPLRCRHPEHQPGGK